MNMNAPENTPSPDMQASQTQAVSPELVTQFNAANAHFREGRWQEALAGFNQALALSPDFEAAMLQCARCEVNLGRSQAARDAFTRLLRAHPQNFSGWLEVGHLCRTLGLMDQSMAAYRKCTQVAPPRWESWLALTRALEEAALWDEAAVTYHRAAMTAGAQDSQARQQADKPVSANQASKQCRVHWRMARFRLERGDAPRALEALRQAMLIYRIEQHSDVNVRSEMQLDLGEILMRLGMTEQGHRAFERASGATSEAVLVRLAEISFRFNLWQEAQEVLKRNVQLHPDSALAHWNLAHSYAESWQMNNALAELARAEAIEPMAGAKSMRASVAGRIGDADTALQLYRELAEAEGPLSKMCSSAAMSSLYSDKLSTQEVADLHRQLFAPLGEGARSVKSFANDRTPGRKLRLGMLSADFHHQHPVNIFMQPVLARLNKDQFETTVYFTGVSYDDQTHVARRRVDRWVECTQWGDVQLARRIEQDGIDILLDLAGHTSMQRMSLLAKRAAPVQATFLGYPGSTGVPNIDWLVADPIVAPKGSESLYTEQLMRLPNTVFCYAPEADYPYPVYDDQHAQRPLTFGSFNNVPKLTPHTLKLWADILQAVPDSRLLLKAPSFKDDGAITAFTERLTQLGVDVNRVEFRGPVGLTDMMAEYADVDIALDPVPYNGGTTTLQAMWMGVPVVVKAGGNFVSRMGASFMTAAGLEDWVAKDDVEYVRIAAKMAKDRHKLIKLKRGLRERLQSAKAWDIDQYTRDFETALHAMWGAR